MKGKTFFSIISAFFISISSVSGVYAERIIASDINGDELTDVFDLVMLRGNLENIECDLNNDSQTDAKDLIFLNDYIAIIDNWKKADNYDLSYSYAWYCRIHKLRYNTCFVKG